MNRTSMRVLLVIVASSFSIVTFGVGFGTNSSDFCSNIRDPGFFKTRAYDPRFHLHDKNDGGLFNGGVCWWHALFQRAALYLTVLDPSKPRPDEKQAEKIIHGIASGKRVVTIPGYENVNDFSRDHWPAIQETLDHWQDKDGFLKQLWVSDLLKAWSVSPADLEKKMDRLNDAVERQGEIAWVMIKMPGIGSHAWLVVDMAKTSTGYELQVIDSNFPEIMTTAVYQQGSPSLKTVYGPAVLYLGRQNDFKKFARAQEAYCAGNTGTEDLPAGEYDLDNGLE